MKKQTDEHIHKVILIRHAQSTWNQQGRFTGWADPPLTPTGEAEAIHAGNQLREHGYHFDKAYTSCLQRARKTAELVLQQTQDSTVTIESDWHLNERHYGALQGLNKNALAKQLGESQIWRWRRGYTDRPPNELSDNLGKQIKLKATNPFQTEQSAESLKDTRERVHTFWETNLLPEILNGQRLLIASHGNTLRALIMALDNMSIDAVEAFEIPTGQPIEYRIAPDGTPLGWSYLIASTSQAA